MPWDKVKTGKKVCVVDKNNKTVTCYDGDNVEANIKDADKLLAALYAAESKMKAKSIATVHNIDNGDSPMISQSEIHQSEAHEGVCIACKIPFPLNTKLALPNGAGEPANELHMTLAYLGNKSDFIGYSDDTLSILDRTLSKFAKNNEIILSGAVSGIGVFFGDGDEGTVLYLSVDIPGLPEFRHKLVKALDTEGFPISMDHGFTPHITIAYFDDTPMAVSDAFFPPIIKSGLSNIALSFNDITLMWGDSHIDYKLHSDDALKIMYPWS